jgi:hypothetical protein
MGGVCGRNWKDIHITANCFVIPASVLWIFLLFLDVLKTPREQLFDFLFSCFHLFLATNLHDDLFLSIMHVWYSDRSHLGFCRRAVCLQFRASSCLYFVSPEEIIGNQGRERWITTRLRIRESF